MVLEVGDCQNLAAAGIGREAVGRPIQCQRQARSACQFRSVDPVNHHCSYYQHPADADRRRDQMHGKAWCIRPSRPPMIPPIKQKRRYLGLDIAASDMEERSIFLPWRQPCWLVLGRKQLRAAARAVLVPPACHVFEASRGSGCASSAPKLGGRSRRQIGGRSGIAARSAWSRTHTDGGHLCRLPESVCAVQVKRGAVEVETVRQQGRASW